MSIEWFDPSTIIGANEKWLKKINNSDYKGDNKEDIESWMKAMVDFYGIANKHNDEHEDYDDWFDYCNIIDDNVYQLGSVAIFIEVRGSDLKFIHYLIEDEYQIGKYEGLWNNFLRELNVNKHLKLEMIPAVLKHYMGGHTDVESFLTAGTLTIDGDKRVHHFLHEILTYYYEDNGILIE